MGAKRTDFDKGGVIIDPLKKLVRFYQTISEMELKIDSNLVGVKLRRILKNRERGPKKCGVFFCFQ